MNRFSRRDLLLATTVAAGSFGLGEAVAQNLPGTLPATPACDSDARTPSQTEGPYFTPRSPERADLREPGLAGQPVMLTGFVLTRGCKPVARAVVDLWHADDTGEYDNKGFRLRGHVYTDAAGRYAFRTIKPAFYPGRTRHYHVKVQGGASRVLTTQLYFPDEPANARDGLYRRELLMRVAQARDAGVQDALAARFDFVLDIR
jgi:protocatechuate 3,4-dioxygenase beta subunit